MTSFRSAGRSRQIDGPMRRVNSVPHIDGQLPEIMPPAAEPGIVEPTPAEANNVTDVVEPSPVFVYHKQEALGVETDRWLKWARRGALAGLCLLLVGGGWFALVAWHAAGEIITKAGRGAPALAADASISSLRQGDGRINILMLGVGGDGHDGAFLSDTIMVASIDPVNNSVALLSVPRDLYVHIPAYNEQRAIYGKINEANARGGPKLAEQVVSSVIGQPIHYYVQVDFSGFKQAVDAVGGVTINVPTTINDPLYPCDDNVAEYKYCPILITAGLHHMTGEVALEYARSRETTSDFDRAARQQLVLEALKQKAEQLATLTNPLKVTSLIGAIGSHVTTDLQMGDMIKLASMLKNVESTHISNQVLSIYGANALLVNGAGEIPGNGYIELPAAGPFNYSGIQSFVAGYFVDPHITAEHATVQVENGTTVAGLAGTLVASLAAAKYNVGTPINAAAHYAQTQIIDYTGGKKPYTLSYLEHRLGVHAQEASIPANASGASPQIRIILGQNYSTSQSTQ